LIDGYSIAVLLHELESILQDRELPTPTQFSDAVYFQRHAKLENQSENDIFWKKSLAAAHDLRPLHLPKPATVPSLAPNRPDWSFQTSKLACNKPELDSFARSQRISASSLFHAAWALLLSKYTRAATVGYNMSLSGRTMALAATESIVGPLNQRCPVLTSIDPTAALERYLKGVHRQVYELGDFQWSSYGVLEEVLGAEAYERLYTTSLVVFWDMPADSGRWKLRDEQRPVKPLELRVEQYGEAISLQMGYYPTRFDGGAVGQFLADFVRIVATILRSPADSPVQSVMIAIA
jgi:hypothetical protein